MIAFIPEIPFKERVSSEYSVDTCLLFGFLFVFLGASPLYLLSARSANDLGSYKNESGKDLERPSSPTFSHIKGRNIPM